jgi:hypothetical protein
MHTTNLAATIRTDEAVRPTWADRTRQTIRRLDRYTLEVMNPGHPYRLGTDRPA